MTVLDGCNYICERPRRMEGFSEWPQVSFGTRRGYNENEALPQYNVEFHKSFLKGLNIVSRVWVGFSFSFSFIYFTLGYSIYIVYVTNRNKITNKRRKRKKLMVLVEVCSGQRSLAFELTTATL